LQLWWLPAHGREIGGKNNIANGETTMSKNHNFSGVFAEISFHGLNVLRKGQNAQFRHALVLHRFRWRQKGVGRLWVWKLAMPLSVFPNNPRDAFYLASDFVQVTPICEHSAA